MKKSTKLALAKPKSKSKRVVKPSQNVLVREAWRRGFTVGAGNQKKIDQAVAIRGAKHSSLMMGSFLSGVLADLGMVGVGEEVMGLFRAGRYVEANQLMVGALEKKVAQGEASDVYIYRGGGWIRCCNCRLLGEQGDFSTQDTGAMIRHLREHEVAGHAVPANAAARLRTEALGLKPMKLLK